MSSKQRVLVINQYYWPGVESTAQLLTDLCEGLAEELDISVVTGCLRETAERPGRFVRNGVAVQRVRSTVFDRARLLPRAANYLSFLFGSLTASLATKRP